MYIVIAGIGKVGSYLTEELSREGHDITIVDQKPEKLQSVSGHFDVMALAGNIIDPSTIDELDLDTADLFIAVTTSDEVNLLACLLAKKAGCPRTIARVRSPEYAGAMDYLQKQLSLAMIINPEELAAREILRILRLPSAIDVDVFAQGKAEILKFRLGESSGMDQMAIKEVPSKIHKDVLVCAVEREGKAYIPDGDFVLQSRDLVSIAGRPRDGVEFLSRIGISKTPVKTVMIVGAGRLSFYVAQMLAKAKIKTIVIEKDFAACERFAASVPEAIVINGDGSDQNLLYEEGLDNMDAFIALTGIDEENVFLSLYASKKHSMKTITKVTRIFLEEVFETLDLDTIINPKKLTAETILHYVRSLKGTLSSNVESLHKLAGDQVEALEFTVSRDCSLNGIPLQKLPLKPGVLITMIYRDGKVILPRGSDALKEEDHVVVVTTHSGVCDLEDLLRTRSRL